MKTSFVFLADGFEEVEAIAPVDIMRRAGLDVKTVSINESHIVTGAHGVQVKADLTFKEASFADSLWLICPGGMPGATHLHEFTALGDLLRVHAMNGGKIAAICASPAVVLAPLGLLDGLTATAYPGFEDAITKGGATYVDDHVVAHENIITGQGPAAAFQFGLAIVANTLGGKLAGEVAAGMLL